MSSFITNSFLACPHDEGVMSFSERSSFSFAAWPCTPLLINVNIGFLWDLVDVAWLPQVLRISSSPSILKENLTEKIEQV